MKDPKLICLFAHFNALNQVAPYVITYLEQLENLGFETIFISNSPVKQEYKDLLTGKIKRCTIAERENKGADFGAWKYAFENNLIPGDLDYLLLTNDSLYGPLCPLQPIVESMQSKKDLDFWGLTDSFTDGWHIQSYFVWLSKKVVNADAFKNLFKQDFSGFTKLQIIRNGELQLTKSLTTAGFKGAAYITYDRLDPDFENGNLKNPTHFFWDSLIARFNFPFIKKELILQNPENIDNTDKVFSLVAKYSSYPVENIKQSISDYLAIASTTHVFPAKISVLCHLYYPCSIYYFLTKIAPLNGPETQFVFNLSRSLYHNSFFREMLTKYFPGAITLYTPNQGRDIGGKLAAFDALIRSGIQTEYSLIIHDKLSPHTPTGIEWRDTLLKIIDPEQLQNVFRVFQHNKDAGVITAKEFIQNEFVPDENRFTCTSSTNLLNYIQEYKLAPANYNFAAGTIFWIRTEILRNFFSSHTPLSVRKKFEKGNSLDFDGGTNIHAWERLFSFIAGSQGFKTIGV